MKKEVTACDYEEKAAVVGGVGWGNVPAVMCPTFATSVCTFCGKDFCPKHIAGSFRAAIETVPKMAEPTSSSPARPLFTETKHKVDVDVCKACGESIATALSLNASFVLAVAKEFSDKGVEATNAARAAVKLAQDKR